MTRPYIHPASIVEDDVSIGNNTRIWTFVHILPNVKIGSDCNICDHVLIESEVTIGDRVTVKSGIYLWRGVSIEDDVFLGPNVVFTNDKAPRSKRYPVELSRTLVRKGASIGANATILPEVEIGEFAMVGAGTVVTKSVQKHALVVGNPGQLVGWVCQCGIRLDVSGDEALCACGARFSKTGETNIEAINRCP